MLFCDLIQACLRNMMAQMNSLYVVSPTVFHQDAQNLGQPPQVAERKVMAA